MFEQLPEHHERPQRVGADGLQEGLRVKVSQALLKAVQQHSCIADKHLQHPQQQSLCVVVLWLERWLLHLLAAREEANHPASALQLTAGIV